MKEEIWKPIPVAPNYEVSNLGRVRRTTYRKQRPDDKGYDKLNLCVNGEYTNHFVHRLVMLAFVGQSQLQVNHKNGNKLDNRLENLEYVTSEENIRHADLVLNRIRIGKGRPRKTG